MLRFQTILRRSSSRLARPRRLHTTVHTILHPTPQSVRAHIDSLSLSSDSVGLYLLHPELNDISSVLSAVQDGLTIGKNSIGSFAQSASRLQQLQSQPQAEAEEPFVTIATFTPSNPRESILLFRSELLGLPPVSVGRWHRPELSYSDRNPASSADKMRQEDRKGEDVGEIERVLMGSLGFEKGESIGWEGLWRSERLQAGETGEGPGDGLDAQGVMKGLEGLEGATGVKHMLVLSDSLPNPTITSLDRNFPQASKLGLLTEPTPFLTGKPHTLFRNKDIFEAGAVGLAFCESTVGDDPSGPGFSTLGMKAGIEYGGLERLSGLETIDDAQGNLLLSFHPSTASSTQKQTNPTQVLIKLLNVFQSASSATRPSEAGTAEGGVSLGKKMKEEEYYLAIWGNGEDGTGEPREVVRILSGDPSRGALSLDMETPLRTGQKVQFMHKPRNDGKQDQTVPRARTISFSTLPTENAVRLPAWTSGNTEVIEGISVGTEGGFFYSPGQGEKTARTPGSVCKVVGANGWLKV